MSDASIRCRGLGKAYRLGGASATTIGDLLRCRRKRASERDFWALRALDLEVAQGEALAVIGNNGAGKSTLLKLLARITEPTEGRAEIRGRVGAMLEVGTGFHPELTGRENVRLGGALMGMTRGDVRKHFDDIVTFAGVERFMDEPLKHWSSGMQARLAFAVAAHVEPEILLVDEVLAVGDAEFQRRCLGRMEKAAGGGRTVLFTSHHLGSVRRLCRRALWLDHGRARMIGPVQEVLDAYLGSVSASDDGDLIARANSNCPPRFRWESASVEQDGRPTTAVANGQPICLRCRFAVNDPAPGLRIFADILDEHHEVLFRSFHDDRDDRPAELAAGRWEAQLAIPADTLLDRAHWIHLQATVHDDCMLGGGISWRIEVQRTSGTNRAYPQQPLPGRLLSPGTWTVERLSP